LLDPWHTVEDPGSYTTALYTIFTGSIHHFYAVIYGTFMTFYWQYGILTRVLSALARRAHHACLPPMAASAGAARRRGPVPNRVEL
jgi:hypothetical protein